MLDLLAIALSSAAAGVLSDNLAVGLLTGIAVIALLTFVRAHHRSTPSWVQREAEEANPLIASINEGKCPDCGGSNLLAGPSGGLCQNIACASCLSEFNACHGFDGSAFYVDRSGKLSMGRAQSAFGITPEEFRAAQDADYRNALDGL